LAAQLAEAARLKKEKDEAELKERLARIAEEERQKEAQQKALLEAEMEKRRLAKEVWEESGKESSFNLFCEKKGCGAGEEEAEGSKGAFEEEAKGRRGAQGGKAGARAGRARAKETGKGATAGRDSSAREEEKGRSCQVGRSKTSQRRRGKFLLLLFVGKLSFFFLVSDFKLNAWLHCCEERWRRVAQRR
jgi:hypothetical protein